MWVQETLQPRAAPDFGPAREVHSKTLDFSDSTRPRPASQCSGKSGFL